MLLQTSSANPQRAVVCYRSVRKHFLGRPRDIGFRVQLVDKTRNHVIPEEETAAATQGSSRIAAKPALTS